MNVANMAGVPTSIIEEAEKAAEQFERANRLKNPSTRESMISLMDMSNCVFLRNCVNASKVSENRMSINNIIKVMKSMRIQ